MSVDTGGGENIVGSDAAPNDAQDVDALQRGVTACGLIKQSKYQKSRKNPFNKLGQARQTKWKPRTNRIESLQHCANDIRFDNKWHLMREHTHAANLHCEFRADAEAATTADAATLVIVIVHHRIDRMDRVRKQVDRRTRERCVDDLDLKHGTEAKQKKNDGEMGSPHQKTESEKLTVPQALRNTRRIADNVKMRME